MASTSLQFKLGKLYPLNIKLLYMYVHVHMWHDYTIKQMLKNW